MAEEIVTERLVLRRATAADTPFMHRIFTNAAAMKYWSSLPHTELAQTEQWMASMIDSPPELSDDYVVTLDGKTIGKLGCWRLPEVGFILDPAAWGRGFAAEALTAFVDHRRAKGGEELTADVDPGNLASIRLLKNAGFEETGRQQRTWEIGGNWFDSVYLRLDLQR